MLLRNTVFNLVGLGAPLLAAIVTIPALVGGLGEAKFGVLTLIWAVVGYFGLLDLGLGRALTLRLSAAVGGGREREVGTVSGTALLMLAVLGGVSGALLFVAAKGGIATIDHLPDQADALGAVIAMAWALPFVILTSGFRGILESQNRFLVLNALRIPLGLLTFLGPWAVVMRGHTSLELIGVVLAIGRVIGCGLHGWVALSAMPIQAPLRISRAEIAPLLTAGGWMTISNIVSPLMSYADRFLIAGMLSASAVAYFATPQEIATKLWIVPAALSTVLFPKIAAVGIEDVRTKLRRTMWQATAVLIIAVYLPTLILALFAQQILSLWIGPEFAENSHFLLQCFAIGILLNTPAHIPLTLLQGVGRAKAVALVHLFELPLFIALTWWLLSEWSLAGAGAAWTLRCLVDTAIMFWLAHPQLRPSDAQVERRRITLWIWVVSLAILPFAALLTPVLVVRGVAAALGGGVCAMVALSLWRARYHSDGWTLKAQGR